jgi:hypothetical protein
MASNTKRILAKGKQLQGSAQESQIVTSEVASHVLLLPSDCSPPEIGSSGSQRVLTRAKGFILKRSGPQCLHLKYEAPIKKFWEELIAYFP